MGRITIEEALDDCLTRMPQEGLEACLRRYPEFAEELKPLLQTAAQLRRLGVPTQLNTAVRERMRSRIFLPSTAPTAPPSVPTQPNLRPRPVITPTPLARPRFVIPTNRWARVAAAVFVFALVFWGVGAASAASNPDDTLYPVKRFYEGVRYTFSLSGPARANAKLEFAGVRLNEIETVAQRKQRISGSLISDLDGNVGYCVDELNGNDLSDKRTFAAQVGAVVQRERILLDQIADALAPDAEEVYKTAQQNITTHYSTARQYAPDLPATLPQPASTMPAIGTPQPITPTAPALPITPTLSITPTPSAASPTPLLTPSAEPTAPSATPTGEPKLSATPESERTRQPDLTPHRAEPTETARARPPSPPPATVKPKPVTATPTNTPTPLKLLPTVTPPPPTVTTKLPLSTATPKLPVPPVPPSAPTVAPPSNGSQQPDAKKDKNKDKDKEKDDSKGGKDKAKSGVLVPPNLQRTATHPHRYMLCRNIILA